MRLIPFFLILFCVSPAGAHDKNIHEVRQRIKEVFGVKLPDSVMPDKKLKKFCDNQAQRIMFARKSFLYAHQVFQKPKSLSRNERLLDSAYRQGWAIYASELMFPGLPAWKYLTPCEKSDAKHELFKKAEHTISQELAQNLNSSDQQTWEKYFSGFSTPNSPYIQQSGAFIGYYLAKSLEGQMDRKMIQLLTFDEFKKLFPSWLKEELKTHMTKTKPSKVKIKKKSKDSSIGMATMESSGDLRLTLRAEDPAGSVGDASFVYPKGHPKYDEILKHIGGLKPGQSKSVPPWDLN